jgi:hypothetical protein
MSASTKRSAKLRVVAVLTEWAANTRKEENELVETVIVVGLIAFFAKWAYKSGKSTGSTKGFSAGRKSRRRRR